MNEAIDRVFDQIWERHGAGQPRRSSSRWFSTRTCVRSILGHARFYLDPFFDIFERDKINQGPKVAVRDVRFHWVGRVPGIFFFFWREGC